MIDIEAKKPGDRAIVKISGEFSILHAAGLRDTLMETLGVYKSVEIRIDEMEDIDLSSIQIFCAAHKTALSMDKELIVAGTIPAVIGQIIIGSGYSRHSSCSLDKDHSCLWIKEHTNE
jgi:anti-anti-sigma regulatory factor